MKINGMKFGGWVHWLWLGAAIFAIYKIGQSECQCRKVGEECINQSVIPGWG